MRPFRLHSPMHSPRRQRIQHDLSDVDPRDKERHAWKQHCDAPAATASAPSHGGCSQYTAALVRTSKAVHDGIVELQLLARFLRANCTSVQRAINRHVKQRAAGAASGAAAAAGTGSGCAAAGASRTTCAATTDHAAAVKASMSALIDSPKATYAFLAGHEVAAHLSQWRELEARLAALEPRRALWAQTRVYTIGCMDVFHHGHANLLQAMRRFGRTVVVGIHDDESIRLLKGSYPIDCLEKRLRAIKPYCDEVFVIHSTDPTPAIKAVVRDVDIARGTCLYVRGDDMPSFPAREWVESVMDVVLLPRTENVSSSFIRAVYHHADSECASHAAAWAEMDAVGKPVLPSTAPAGRPVDVARSSVACDA